MTGKGHAWSFTVMSREYLSADHLFTALHNSAMCAKRENELMGKRTVDPCHRSYAMAAVLSAVSFLESLVNEVFEDVRDKLKLDDTRVKGIRRPGRRAMTAFWEATDRGQYRLLDKFDMALLLNSKESFNKGEQPYQDAKLLVDLRNALVHFRPEWHEHGTPGKLETRLAMRMKPSGLIPADYAAPWVPVKVLGASCAEWSVQTVQNFADQWTTRLAIARTYESQVAEWQAQVEQEALAASNGE